MSAAEQDSIEQCLERIRKAWDEGNARAYAQEFTEDATYVIFLGDSMVGREAIEHTHIAVLARWQKGTRMVLRPLSIRFPLPVGINKATQSEDPPSKAAFLAGCGERHDES